MYLVFINNCKDIYNIDIEVAYKISKLTNILFYILFCSNILCDCRLKLSDFMVTCGDCELQSTIMEVILQLLFADSQQNSISESLFPSYPAVQDAYKLFTFENVRSVSKLLIS